MDTLVWELNGTNAAVLQCPILPRLVDREGKIVNYTHDDIEDFCKMLYDDHGHLQEYDVCMMNFQGDNYQFNETLYQNIKDVPYHNDCNRLFCRYLVQKYNVNIAFNTNINMNLFDSDYPSMDLSKLGGYLGVM